jgi:hypothetical protein
MDSLSNYSLLTFAMENISSEIDHLITLNSTSQDFTNQLQRVSILSKIITFYHTQPELDFFILEEHLKSKFPHNLVEEILQN